VYAQYDDVDDVVVMDDWFEHEESDRVGEAEPSSGTGGCLLTLAKRTGTVNFNLAATRFDGSPSTS